MDEEEEWRDVVGYENIYQVSNLGRMRSYVVKHQPAYWSQHKKPEPKWALRRTKASKGQVPKPVLVKPGGFVPSRSFPLSDLILEAFGVPKPGEQYSGYPIDGDPNNTRLDNLEWQPSRRRRSR